MTWSQYWWPHTSCFDVLSVLMTSHDTSEGVVASFSTTDLTNVSCCQYQISHTTHLTRLWRVCQYQWSHTTRQQELWCVVSTNDLILHVCKSCDVLSVAAISYETEDEVRNDNKCLKLSILTAVMLDVSQRWIQSRRVHTADRKKTAVVVVNKGRVRSGQAVHRRRI